MTLVAGFAINNFPVVLGDVLLSAKGASIFQLELPSVRRINLPDDLEKYPLGMRQKIAVISDRLIIGWAGDAGIAQREIQMIRQLNESEPFTIEAIRECSAKLKLRTSPAQLGLVGLLREPSSQYNWFFGLRAAIGTHSDFGPGAMIGSGVDYFQTYLTKQTYVLKSSDARLSAAQFGVLFALRTVGDLLGREFATQKTLEQFFGAGYEIVVPNRERLEKLDDITYAFWIVKPGEIEYKLMHAFKYWYVNDVLWIRAALLQPSLDIVIRPEPFPVTPIDRPLTTEDYSCPELATFDSDWVCHIFILFSPINQIAHSFPLVLHQTPTTRQITFHESGGRLSFNFRDEKEIIELIRRGYQQLSEAGK